MVRCAFCDADFEAGPGDVLLVCPYCGTAQTTAGAKFKDHYMIRVHFSQSEAQRILLDWCSKQLGAPQNLPVAARFVKAKLIFYPFWISRVDADTRYKGLGKDARFRGEWPQRPGAYKHIDFFYKPESGRFQRRYEINVPGVEDIDEDIKNFPIPTRAKEYFSHAHAEEYDGKVLHSQVSEEQARELARKMAYDRQTALILEEVDKIESRDDDIDVGETFLIHVPVWELEYRYGSRTYKASVSASTGYVIESKYPRSMAFRGMAIGGGLINLAIGAGLLYLALKVGILVGGGIVSGGILTALGLSLLYKGVSRKEAKEKI
ncbi:MAG: hypothetical protein ACTSPE_13060 [Candidatus Thorarchaeota archaeon]